MIRNNSTILLGENDDITGGSIKDLLVQLGFTVLKFSDSIETLRKSFTCKPDLIIINVEMSKLNGYQFTRIIRNENSLEAIPIIHIGSTNTPIEQYWSKMCGGNEYLKLPLRANDLENVITRYLKKGSRKRQLFTPISAIGNLDDQSILHLAGSLLENDLLKSNFLNEINILDTLQNTMQELITKLMMIIESLFDFTIGAVLIDYEQYIEYYFYQYGTISNEQINKIKTYTFQYLNEHHSLFLEKNEIKQNIIRANQQKEKYDQIDDLYIYTNDYGPVNSVLIFVNMGFESLTSYEQNLLTHALLRCQGAIQKRMYFEVSQKLSIIDAVTEGYNLDFFMACLTREIETSIRKKYPLSLITISISNYDEILQKSDESFVNKLIRNISNLMLRTMRKSDVASKWGIASFAIMFPFTSLEKGEIAQKRVSTYILNNIKRSLPKNTKLQLDMGLGQYDPKNDDSPEDFFERCKGLDIEEDEIEEDLPDFDPEEYTSIESESISDVPE